MHTPLNSYVLAGRTIAKTEQILSNALIDADISNPEYLAQLLVEHSLALDRTGRVMFNRRLITAIEEELILAMLTRLLCGEPIQRILGHTEFWGMTFNLSPHTFIPRPDTETLVEAVVDLRHNLYSEKGETSFTFADIGTGTGVILAAILSEFPDSFGTGTDISLDIISVAKENLVSNGLSNRAEFYVCPFDNDIPINELDIVTSNPPYIPEKEISRLAPEVRNYDPLIAINGGKDGLNAYRTIIPKAKNALKVGGYLFLEIGYNQGTEVQALLHKYGFRDTNLFQDLAGHPRVLRGIKTNGIPSGPRQISED